MKSDPNDLTERGCACRVVLEGQITVGSRSGRVVAVDRNVVGTVQFDQSSS